MQWTGNVSRDSIRAQKQDILTLFSYHEWSAEIEPPIQNKLCELLLSASPKLRQTSKWDVVFSRQTNNSYRLSGVNYNRTLQPGATITPGFCGSY